jgi:hypothetical protein
MVERHPINAMPTIILSIDSNTLFDIIVVSIALTSTIKD